MVDWGLRHSAGETKLEPWYVGICPLLCSCRPGVGARMPRWRLRAHSSVCLVPCSLLALLLPLGLSCSSDPRVPCSSYGPPTPAAPLTIVTLGQAERTVGPLHVPFSLKYLLLKLVFFSTGSLTYWTRRCSRGTRWIPTAQHLPCWKVYFDSWFQPFQGVVVWSMLGLAHRGHCSKGCCSPHPVGRQREKGRQQTLLGPVSHDLLSSLPWAVEPGSTCGLPSWLPVSG